MQFGIYLNGYGTPSRSGPATLAEAVEQARLAEQAGFSWAVLGERHLHAAGHLEILTTAAVLAARTHTIGVATAGIVLPFYSPVFLAEALAGIDVASDGRLTAGFVLGYRPEEFVALEADFGGRAARFERSLTTIQALWAGEPVQAAGPAGEPVELVAASRPVQRPRPRIWNGGRVPAALRRTAQLCDGWTTSFNEDPGVLGRKVAAYRALPAGPRSLGRQVLVCRDAFCAPTSQQARAAVEAPLLGFFAEYAAWKKSSVDAGRYTDLSWDAVAPRLLVGSPARLVEQIGRYGRLGADALILRVQAPGLDHAAALRCIDLLGREVLPAFSALSGAGAGPADLPAAPAPQGRPT